MTLLPIRRAVLSRVGHAVPELLLIGAVLCLVVLGTILMLRLFPSNAGSTVVPIPTLVTGRVTCADFASQRDAQAVFETDPVKYRTLDANRDGVACQGLRGG